jgi:hypothetical protein
MRCVTLKLSIPILSKNNVATNVVKHRLGSSPSRTTPQHEEGIFFCVHSLLEEGLPEPLTSSNFTQVPPNMTAIEFVTGTRPLEITFGFSVSH